MAVQDHMTRVNWHKASDACHGTYHRGQPGTVCLGVAYQNGYLGVPDCRDKAPVNVIHCITMEQAEL